MSALYDLTLLLDTAAPEERRTKILGDVQAAIAAGGSIESTHDWGARALTYEIDKHNDAEYHLIQFTGTPELLEQLQRMLHVADGVLRFRIIKVRPGTPAPPDLRGESATAPAADESAPAPAA